MVVSKVQSWSQIWDRERGSHRWAVCQLTLSCRWMEVGLFTQHVSLELLPRQLSIYIRGRDRSLEREEPQGLVLLFHWKTIDNMPPSEHTQRYIHITGISVIIMAASVLSDRMADGGAVRAYFSCTHCALCKARKATHLLSTTWVGVSLLTPTSSDSWDSTGWEMALFGYEHVFSSRKSEEWL